MSKKVQIESAAWNVADAVDDLIGASLDTDMSKSEYAEKRIEAVEDLANKILDLLHTVGLYNV